MAEQRSPDTPFLASQTDRFGIEEAHRDIVFRAEPSMQNLANQALQAMSANGDEAEANYQTALSELRSAPDEAVATLGATYNSLDDEQYLERCSMIQLLTDLRVRQAVDLLDEVVRRPIPPERSPIRPTV